MIEGVFLWADSILRNSGTGYVLVAALVWGVLSIVLSPCHLASIPLIVGFLNGQGRIRFRRALALSTVFSVGIMLSILLVGLVTGLLGRIYGDLGSYGNIILAVVLILMGLYLAGWLRLPFLDGLQSPTVRRHGYSGALLLGLVMGLTLGPCTFAFMAPVLGVVLGLAAGNLFLAVFVVLMFATGHCAVIILAGVSAEAVQRYLHWNEQSGAGKIFRMVCGMIVVLAGSIVLWSSVRDGFF